MPTHSHRALVLVAALPVLLILVLALPASARAPMALGVSRDGYGRTVTQPDVAWSLADHIDDMNGEVPALWSIWSQWGDPSTRDFPNATVEQVASVSPDIVPVIWWEPTDPRGDNWTRGRFERYVRIVDGKHDDYIRSWAQAAKANGRRMVVRFAHEMNGKAFPWGIGWFDNTPSNFKAAWRRVWRIFKEEGALAPTGNVEFLWSVTKQLCPGGCNPFSAVYPGDTRVHWVGVTAFNWGVQKSWKSMVTVLAGPLKNLRKLTKKPVIVAETASHFKGGDKAAWIRNGYRSTYERWPWVRALLYLDAVGPHNDFGHPDWRLDKPNDGSAREAYAGVAAKPEFQGSLPNP